MKNFKLPIAMLHMAFGRLQFSRSFRQFKKLSLYHPRRNIASDNGFLRISEEVREALHAKLPVVALETTIYTHGRSLYLFTRNGMLNEATTGFPYPENVALASELESIVRINGGWCSTRISEELPSHQCQACRRRLGYLTVLRMSDSTQTI